MRLILASCLLFNVLEGHVKCAANSTLGNIISIFHTHGLILRLYHMLLYTQPCPIYVIYISQEMRHLWYRLYSIISLVSAYLLEYLLWQT